MRAEQRRKILFVTGLITLGIGLKFVLPLDYPLWQRIAMIAFLVVWMVLTVWVPIRKKSRRRRRRSSSSSSSSSRDYESIV